MKKLLKGLAFMLSLAMLLTMVSVSGMAYGSDRKLIITHLNPSTAQNCNALILSGDKHATLGEVGNFAWWGVFVFDWDETDAVYKVTGIHDNKNGEDKTAVAIPETGFAYCVHASSQMVNSDVIRCFDYINATTLPIGTKAYLYGVNLHKSTLDDNGKLWYESDYVSNAYIKLDTPEDGAEAYDPTLYGGYDLTPSAINNVKYAYGETLMFTRAFGESVSNQPQGEFQWWRCVIVDWNVSRNCYTVISYNGLQGDSAMKQPLIPENGFVIMDYSKNGSENLTACKKLAVGTDIVLYDIDLEKGTFGDSPTIHIGALSEGRNAYAPELENALASPVLDQADAKGNIHFSTGDNELTWQAVAGADGYRVAVNDASFVTDGKLAYGPSTVTGTSLTLPEELFDSSHAYTISIEAVSDTLPASTVTRSRMLFIPESLLGSNLLDKKIVAFGDSLTAKPGYVQMLFGLLGTEVVNAATSGDMSSQALGRFKTKVLDENPDIVLICLGMNDQAAYLLNPQKTPCVDRDTFRKNMEYFASELKSRDIDVIFITPNPVNSASGYYKPGNWDMDYSYGYMDEYCDIIRRVAIENDCGLIDVNTMCKDEDLSKFLAVGDGVHQSQYGHSKYAEWIAAYLHAVYDGVNERSIKFGVFDYKRNMLASYTVKGAEGMSITLPFPEIEGYYFADSDSDFEYGCEMTFKNESTVSATYSQVVPTLGADSEYTMASGTVSRVKIGTTVGDFLSNFSGGNYGVAGIDGKTMASKDVIYTGCVFKGDYTVAVTGDINGDGRIGALDYLICKRAVLGSYTVSGEKKLAADADGNGKTEAADYVLIKRMFLES